MAKLEKKKGNDDAFLAMCRDLLNEELSTPQKADILRLMGRAFAAHSRHYEAALCFAGMIPPHSADVGEMRGTLVPQVKIRQVETPQYPGETGGSRANGSH